MIEVAVVVLAVARVTRLVCTDKLTERLRMAAVLRLSEGSLLAYLLFCRWCMSVWVGLVAAAGWWELSATPRWSGHWWVDVLTVGLALSYVTGLLVRVEPGE
jgi:hypothetical protein